MSRKKQRHLSGKIFKNFIPQNRVEQKLNMKRSCKKAVLRYLEK